MFNERAIRLGSGTIVPAAKVPSPAEMEALGAAVVIDPAERLLLDRHFYLSGEIPRLSAFEKGRTDHLSRTGPEAPWQPDPLLLDERMLVAHVEVVGADRAQLRARTPGSSMSAPRCGGCFPTSRSIA